MAGQKKDSKTLSDQHLRELLHGSGIPESLIEMRGYWTATKKQELAHLGYPASQQIVPALIIPIWSVYGEIIGHQIKPNSPRTVEGRILKYETPAKTPNKLDICPAIHALIGRIDIPLVITEGVKKADCAAARGICIAALSGVDCGRAKNEYGGITDLADWGAIAWNGRTVYVAFDSDGATNPNVRRAMEKIGNMAKSRGAAKVFYILLPSADGRKVGLDDFYVAGGTSAQLWTYAVEKLPWVQQPAPKDKVVYPLTEYGNALRLVDTFKENIRFCAALGRWLTWTGTHWKLEECDGAPVARMAAQIVRDMIAEAAKTSDPDKRKELLTLASRSDNYRSHQNMMKLAATMLGISVAAEDLDKSTGLLNLSNGTLDTNTLEMRSHRREDYLTRIIDVPYDAEADCPLWTGFLDTILEGDFDLQRYLWKACGYSLTGDNSEKCFFFLYGNQGDNGKSVFIDTIMSILGPYANSTPTSTLLSKSHDGGIPNDLARLKGTRFIAASELGESKRLDEELIKQLTGKDTISARFMRGEWFDFTPQFAIWMTGNYKPLIRGQDPAIWKRVKLIPFTYSVPIDKQDIRLRQKLQAERAGILAWMIDGARAWRDEGLGNPGRIVEAVQAYREDMDVLGEFLRQCTDIGTGFTSQGIKLYEAYEKWCTVNGMKAATNTSFGRNLSSRGIDKTKTKHGALYTGIRLVEDQHLEHVYRGGD